MNIVKKILYYIWKILIVMFMLSAIMLSFKESYKNLYVLPVFVLFFFLPDLLKKYFEEKQDEFSELTKADILKKLLFIVWKVICILLFLCGIMFAFESIIGAIGVISLSIALFFLPDFFKNYFDKRQEEKDRIKREELLQNQRREERILKEQEKERLKKQGIWYDFLDLDFDKIVVLDLETTGLKPSANEILKLSIIDGYGRVLFNKLLKPAKRKTWRDAEAIHGISPKDVNDCSDISYYIDDIREIIKGKVIVGYNIEFDLEFLASSRVIPSVDVNSVDIMRPFAEIYGDWSEYHGDYTFKKLTQCAKYYGYTWPNGKAHDSLADTQATLFCLRKMAGYQLKE